MPLVALDRVSVAFGHLPLLDEIACQVDAGERIAVIGRNGTGKSTLLQILSGELQPDSGLVLRQGKGGRWLVKRAFTPADLAALKAMK